MKIADNDVKLFVDPEDVGTLERAESCIMLIRHSMAVTGDQEESRTLTPEGIKLCQAVAPDYRTLFVQMEEQFGTPAYCHSSSTQAILTGQEIADPLQFSRNMRLQPQVSLEKIHDGRWLEEQKAAGRTIGEIILVVAEDLGLLADQPYNQAMDNMADFFISGHMMFNLTIGFGHEPEPSLFMAKNKLLPRDLIGLEECQAYLVFRDEHRIIEVSKFTPQATLNA